MPAVEQIDNVRALQAIASQLELELRTTQAFMAMVLLASGGTVLVPESVANEIPDDFEISVSRDEHTAIFKVVSGEEAQALREGRDTITVDA